MDMSSLNNIVKISALFKFGQNFQSIHHNTLCNTQYEPQKVGVISGLLSSFGKIEVKSSPTVVHNAYIISLKRSV